MESIDISRLEEAVVVFYRSTSQEQAITHDWLTKAQTSPQAWQFSWQLMELGKVKNMHNNNNYPSSISSIINLIKIKF